MEGFGLMGKRVLEIVMCSEARRGVSQKTGREWTLFKVQANDEHGSPIGEELQSFEDLPLGRGEFEVERRDHPQYGTSFTVKAPSPLMRRLDELEARVAKLEGDRGGVTSVAPSTQVVSASNDPVPF